MICLKPDTRGLLPLYLAASHNLPQIVSCICARARELNALSAHVNALSPDNIPAITVAIQQGYIEVVKILIDSGSCLKTASMIMNPFDLVVDHAIKNSLLNSEKTSEKTKMAHWELMREISKSSLEDYLETIRYAIQKGLGKDLLLAWEPLQKISIFRAFKQIAPHRSCAVNVKLKLMLLFLRAGAGFVIDDSLRSWNDFFKIPQDAQFYLVGVKKTDAAKRVDIFSLPQLESALSDPEIEIDYLALWHTLHHLTVQKFPHRDQVVSLLSRYFPELGHMPMEFESTSDSVILKKAKPLSKVDFPPFDGNVTESDIRDLMAGWSGRLNIPVISRAYQAKLESIFNKYFSQEDFDQLKKGDLSEIQSQQTTFFNFLSSYLKPLCKISQFATLSQHPGLESGYHREVEDFFRLSTEITRLMFTLKQYRFDEYYDEIGISLFTAYKFVERYINKRQLPPPLSQTIIQKLALGYAMRAEIALRQGDRIYAIHGSESAFTHYAKCQHENYKSVQFDESEHYMLLHCLLACYVKLGWLELVPEIIRLMKDRFSKKALTTDIVSELFELYCRKLIQSERYNEAEKQLNELKMLCSDVSVTADFHQKCFARLYQRIGENCNKIIEKINNYGYCDFQTNGSSMNIRNFNSPRLLKWLKSHDINHSVTVAKPEISENLEISLDALSRLTTREINAFLGIVYEMIPKQAVLQLLVGQELTDPNKSVAEEF